MSPTLNREPSTVEDARVSDWLDDKLQTLADLESLDNLLLTVRNQQSLLREQLQDAQNDHKEAQDAASEHTTGLQAKVKQFEKAQKDIDKRLMVMTQSETSDEAVQKFEEKMGKLRKLDIAKNYVELLQQVDGVAQEALSSIGASNVNALESYLKLRSFHVQLIDLQTAADGAAPHLLHHVESQVQHVRTELEKALTSKLNETLKKFHWPKPDQGVPETVQSEFSSNVANLLKLQRPDLETSERRNEPPLVLLPLKVLVEPLELGFRYHFEGDRPTNRPERPEFFLSHIQERILSRYIDFIEAYIQPILTQTFNGTSLSLSYAYIDSCSAFITVLLPMARKKLITVLAQVIDRPPLLSHLIHEVVKFDTQLRDDWQYTGDVKGESWSGLAGELFATDSTFQRWIKAERDFALSRYQEIVDTEDSFELDFDSVGSGKTKPSKAAIRVNDLLESTTDNYRDLVAFSHKLKFLIDIQINIFDMFHERLSEALGVYLARTSTIGRASREDQATLQGIAGLERLCRIFGSADYLERAMRDWNDDVFFLELWSELQHRAAEKSSSQAVLAGTLTVAQVAARTSNTLSENATGDGDITLQEGALFDETATAYAKLRSKTEGIMTDLLANNVRQALIPYTKINPWSSLATHPTSTSAEIDGLLSNMNTLISYLVRAVGTVHLRRLVKSVLQAVDTVLFDQVLLRHSFSTPGAAQFSTDLDAISKVVTKLVDASMVQVGLGRAYQAASLLSIPVKGSKSSGEDDEEITRESVGLFEASKRLFEGDGEDARGLLEVLGLDRLSVAEARKVLARRVELGS